ncbi:DUF5133 domain-containing protein [Streptomyces collinus]|uniref:DUF5133 domain-containing protein n=1 Tax=Streptomyces collinus TaxID=42684 RepID=UPI003B21A4FE
MRRGMGAVACTLCVAPGTRDVGAALAAGRRRLTGARPQGYFLLAAPGAPPRRGDRPPWFLWLRWRRSSARRNGPGWSSGAGAWCVRQVAGSGPRPARSTDGLDRDPAARGLSAGSPAVEA